MRRAKRRDGCIALLRLRPIWLKHEVDTELPADVCDNGLGVADGDLDAAARVSGDDGLGAIGDGGDARDVVVGHAIPGDAGLGLCAVGGEVGEVDVFVGVGGAEVEVESEAGFVGGGVGLLGVDHGDGLEFVVGVGGVGADAAIVAGADVAGLEGGDLRGAVAVADDLGDGSVGVVLWAYESGVVAVHGDGLPSAGVGVVSHVHLHG